MINNYAVFESADLIDIIDNLVSLSNTVSFKRDMSELLKIYRRNTNSTKPIRVSMYTAPFIDENKSYYVLQKDTDMSSCDIQQEYTQLRDRIKIFSNRPTNDNNDKIIQSNSIDSLVKILHTNIESKQHMLDVIKSLSLFITTTFDKSKNTILIHELVSLVFDIFIFKTKGYELNQYLSCKYTNKGINKDAKNQCLISTLLRMIKKKTFKYGGMSNYTDKYISDVSSLIYMVHNQFEFGTNIIYNIIMKCSSRYLSSDICTKIRNKFIELQESNSDFLEALSLVTTESVEDFCNSFNNPDELTDHVSKDIINIKRRNFLIFGDNIFFKMNGGDTMEAIDMVTASLQEFDENTIRKFLPDNLKGYKISFNISSDNIGYLRYNKITRNCMVVSSPSLVSEVDNTRTIASYDNSLYLLFQLIGDDKLYGITLLVGDDDYSKINCIVFDRLNKKEYVLRMGGVV